MSLLKSRPDMVLAVSLLHMANANGDIANEQLNYLLTTLNGNTSLINKADKYIKKAVKSGTNLSDFLNEAKAVTTEEQQQAIVLNMLDIMMSDGHIDSHEERLLQYYVDHFKIPDAEYHAFKRIIELKNVQSFFA